MKFHEGHLWKIFQKLQKCTQRSESRHIGNQKEETKSEFCEEKFEAEKYAKSVPSENIHSYHAKKK